MPLRLRLARAHQASQVQQAGALVPGEQEANKNLGKNVRSKVLSQRHVLWACSREGYHGVAILS